jgi:hypothetical protein
MGQQLSASKINSGETMKGKADEAKTFSERTVEEAEKQGLTMEDQEAAAKENGLAAEVPEIPQAVRDGLMQVFFVRPHFTGDYDDKTLECEFTFPLTDAHKGLLPKRVEEAWKIVARKGFNDMGISDIPPQTITLYLAPDLKGKTKTKDEYEIHLAGVNIGKARIKKIEETGKGGVKVVTRFHFRIFLDIVADNVKFATKFYGRELWMEMGDAQGQL